MTQSAADPDFASTSLDQGASAPARHRKRFAGLRHAAMRWDHAGVVGGLIFLVASLMPSLLPRTWFVQGLVTGISFAFGYGTGLLVAWIARHLVPIRVGRSVRRTAQRAVYVLAAVTVPTMLWLGSAWQNDIRHVVQYPAQNRYVYLGVLLVAVLMAVALIAAARGIRKIYRAVARRLMRWVPPIAARVTAAVLVALLVWGVLTGVVGNGIRALLDEVFSAADHGTHPNTAQPMSPLRSGSPASEVSWNSLGLEGRTFVASGPTAAQIEQLTGQPAMTPIRVYAGRESASSLHAEASLVLNELKRTHAFDREVLALATATGTGWIDPWESDSLEYMFGGDTAIASIQYSFYPSWISFLVDRPRALEAGRELFDAVYPYWAALPSEHRPRLVVFGESLGTFGGTAAFSNVDDLLARTDGALFTGPPNTTSMWRTLTESRHPGTLERLPVVGDGRTVRFAAGPDQLREPGGALTHPHVVFLQHGSDPIVWWTPNLVWSEPDWLTEPRAPDVIPQTHWYPIVSFWQITCDMIAAAAPPPGYGHNYGAEIITAWDAILHPPAWTDADTAALADHGV